MALLSDHKSHPSFFTNISNFMNKRPIRVVKRIDIPLPAKKRLVVKTEHAKHDGPRDAAGVIDQWILERRANSVAERIFSDKNISAWEKTPSLE